MVQLSFFPGQFSQLKLCKAPVEFACMSATTDRGISHDWHPTWLLCAPVRTILQVNKLIAGGFVEEGRMAYVTYGVDANQMTTDRFV